jgi:DNA-directed RNA polymerase specialized sigma24 family protein
MKTSCSCQRLIDAILSSELELNRAIREIMDGEDDCLLRNVASYVYSRYYKPQTQLYDWEHLLDEGLCRFIKAVKKGNLPHKDDCRPFFFEICKRTCYEWNRAEKKMPEEPKEEPGVSNPEPEPEKKPGNPHFPIEDLVVLMEFIEELKIAVMGCLDKIGKKCRLLLWNRFFKKPPVVDPVELSGLLETEGFHVQPNVIKNEIAICKKRLQDCLRLNLNNYYNDLLKS